MSILFYDHLITKAEIHDHINCLEEAENHKGKALQLVDDIIFQSIMSMILEKLEPHHHHTFLSTVHERPYDPEILAYLRDHIGDNIEEEIRAEANKVVKMILKDLKSEE